VKLLRVNVIAGASCGGLLNGLNIRLRSATTDYSAFDPLCLIGPNGSGKSQFLQAIAEIFHSIYCEVMPEHEQNEQNPLLHFEVEYLIRPQKKGKPRHIRASRRPNDNGKLTFLLEQLDDCEWTSLDISDPETIELIPDRVVGYTSGDNATLDETFRSSRSGYATKIATLALSHERSGSAVPDTKLHFIDYSTHLEVLVANMMMGTSRQREALMAIAKLNDIRSFRCVIQLAHNAVPKAAAKHVKQSKRKGVQLTNELEQSLEDLRRCSTCYSYEDKTEKYTFDYWIDNESRRAFHSFWESALDLYSSLHKLSMLNDLALPREARIFSTRKAKSPFATRAVEPIDSDKVFRFDHVQFVKPNETEPVHYVSLSDGEHQFAQLLGTLCMISFPRVLFILDEPESHFNPLWRVRFTPQILDLPTANGNRRDDKSGAAEQECILTTHSPFVPSDLPRNKVFVFSKSEDGKIRVDHPRIETYGAAFDQIIEECFGVRPPMSRKVNQEIEEAIGSEDAEKMRELMDRLGYSAKKVILADSLRRIEEGNN